MKKASLLVLAAAAAASTALADLKIATVDMLVLVRNHSSYESNKQFLLSSEKDGQKRLDAMKDELDALQEEGRKKADEYRNPMLAQAAKDKLEKELMTLQQKLVTMQQRLRTEAMKLQQDLSENEARLLKVQADDIKKRVADFAEKNGYDIILDSTSAIFSKAEFDVTDDVLKEMGVDPKKAKGKEDDESK